MELQYVASLVNLLIYLWCFTKSQFSHQKVDCCRTNNSMEKLCCFVSNSVDKSPEEGFSDFFILALFLLIQFFYFIQTQLKTYSNICSPLIHTVVLFVPFLISPYDENSFSLWLCFPFFVYIFPLPVLLVLFLW